MLHPSLSLSLSLFLYTMLNRQVFSVSFAHHRGCCFGGFLSFEKGLAALFQGISRDECICPSETKFPSYSEYITYLAVSPAYRDYLGINFANSLNIHIPLEYTSSPLEPFRGFE